MTISATLINGNVVLFDGAHRITLTLRPGPFADKQAETVAHNFGAYVESYSVETFTVPLGASDPDAGLEDV